jgi:YD repeat-containing protein
MTWLSITMFVLMLIAPVLVQVPITFWYFYDDLGQVIKVVDSAGVVIEYVYDDVGNLLEIKRSTVPGLAIFNFTPQRGAIGISVTIQGQGFSAVPADNTVRFNGAVSVVDAATPTDLMVTVPSDAITGPIAVTVGGVTATSNRDFTVASVPVISAVSPKATLEDTVIPDLQVTGLNLTGSTFSFPPVFPPPPLYIESAVIDPSGTSATLTVTVPADTAGTYVLLATNAHGQSDTSQTEANTLYVLNATQDTDGDGLTNADEFARGTDALNPDTDGDGPWRPRCSSSPPQRLAARCGTASRGLDMTESIAYDGVSGSLRG